jgi:serine/threonine protein kinase
VPGLRRAPATATTLGRVTPVIPGLTSLTPLGHGGFADVYQAQQQHLNRWVAVKVFRVTLADRVAADQFKAECQAVGRLDGHPNLLTVHDANVLADGHPYMVVERCDSSLAKLVGSRGPMPVDQVVELGLQLARALLHAHSARVVHGDVTPQNVLLRASGAPVLADFGLAVLRDYRGNVPGGFTLEHAAPETVRNDGEVDERSDVYGLGSTLYTALTGAAPFAARPGEDDRARIGRVLSEAPAPASAAPPWLSDLVLAMVAKDPADRPDLTAVADALAAGHSAPLAPGSTPVPAPTRAPTAPPRYLPPSDAQSAGGVDPSPAPSPFQPSPPTPGRPQDHGTGAGQDPTRLRPDPDRAPPAPPAGPQRRAPLLVAAAAVVVLVAAGVVWFVMSPPGEAPRAQDTPAAAPGAPAAPVTGGARIDLDTPVDHATTIDLRWAADEQLDFAVIVGTEGLAEPKTTFVHRVTEFSVPVEPDRKYCFLVQGVNPAGTVSESNIRSVRDAVCRLPQQP